MSKPKVPSYCHHKGTDRAFVTLRGQRIYLGRYGTDESRMRYQRVIVEFLATGQLPQQASPSTRDLYTVGDLVADFISDPENRYLKNGRPTSENDLIKMALKRLIQSHLDVPVVEFGPIAFRGVIGVMIGEDLATTTIQKLRGRILRAFKWAVANEKCPASVYEALRTVPSPRMGRGQARDPEPVQPVSDDVIEKTLPHLEPMVAAMVRLQRLTGMRPGEVCTIRGMDLDLEGQVVDGVRVWLYAPPEHKLAHRSQDRVLGIGVRGQEVLKPYLTDHREMYVFRPEESARARAARLREHRVTPMTPSQTARDARRKADPKTNLAEHYTVHAYRQAITRACKRAGVELWSPNQLRHTFMTEHRKNESLDAIQVQAGHRHVSTTQIYARRNVEAAVRLMARVG